jgi:CDP-4-dehydro-6-deoxyglucose reductase
MTIKFRVTIASLGASFDVNAGETILDAAENAGFNLPYGCRRGMCGTCVARVCAGEVNMPGDDLFGLMDDERERGYILMCSTYAVSDLELDDVGLLP